MRIACFANNWLGWKVVEALSRQGEAFAALVLHPQGRRRYGDEILRAAGVNEADALDGSRLG
ncbi:MAG TPA: hypothetical protein VGQ32_08190, partial [Thermoanaerobaculia bacterium]|nr:hypothetical protein [Thermoanaerobaculia bacterium]